MHCSTLVGHLGMRKTIEALQWQVWWPGMAQDVRHFIAGCLPCLQSKDRTSLPPGSLAPIPLPLDHFSFWTMDFITSLPEDQGCNAIFTCIDKLTKLVRLTPCHMGRGCYPQSRLRSSFMKIWSGSLGYRIPFFMTEMSNSPANFGLHSLNWLAVRSFSPQHTTHKRMGKQSRCIKWWNRSWEPWQQMLMPSGLIG